LTLNVVRSSAPIKGAASAGRGKLSLEQLIGGAAMLVDGGHVLFDPRDLGLQDFDAFGQFILGYRPQILLDEQGQGVLRPAGKEVILVHAASVDPDRSQVNKLPPVAWERA